eukprot:GEMP01002579.1.p1 GENE.GEMP01002579.1~~GEMP01002579.1.p1  ORF type:complete len:1000 (+),score=191.70 GEMP01002579.1:161-3160(+)
MKPNLILRLWGWLTFAHIYPILKLGKTRPLTHADLSSLNADVNVDDLYDQFMETFHKEKAVWKSFYLLFRGKFWLSIGLYIFSPLALFFVPIVVGKLVSTVSRDPNDAPNGSQELRWLWAVLIFLTQIVSLSAESMSARVIVCAALRARTIMNVAVFRMSITHHAHHLVSVERLNLMTQDSQRLVEFAAIMIRCLTAPLQLVAGIIYAYVLVGWPVLVGVAFMVLFVPLGAWMAQMSYVISKRKMKATDVRVGYVDEILQAIKVLKSNAWDDACLDEVERRRRVELRQLFFFKLLESLFVPVSVMMPPLATVSVFLTLSFHSAGEIFVASTVFQVVAIFTTFRGPFLVLPVGISLGSQVFTSLNRFQVFLSTQPKRASVAASVLSQDVTTYTWEAVDEAEERIPFSLIIPKCDIVPGSLLAVVGPLGSGKTAFLKTLLGEMTSSVAIDQTIAYCAQSPFIRHTTLQGNILGEEEFDSKRYDDVIKRCQLESDFDQLPLGDETEIGERGLNLSGGQKARVAIARAVYSRCDMLLFDDVLAALDSAVASSIITDVLMRETRTRIVVSVNMDVAKAADQVLFIADGTALPPATYDELLASSDAFRAFAKPSDPATWCTKNAQDKHVEERVIKEQVIPFGSLCGSSQKSINFVEPERMCRGTVPFAAYKTYFASGAYSNSLVLLFLAMTFILAEASGIAMDLWLAQWTDDVLKIGSDSPRYIEIYAAIAFGYFVLQLARSMLFTLFGYRVAVVLHNQLMRGVVKSPLRFFDATPSGRILNRASNDVSGVDFQLTNRWYVLILTFLRVLSVLVVMSISAPIFVAVVLPLMAVHYCILNFYRHSSRESQRLENTSRSPVVSAFTEVVHGLSTIRAYKWERSMVKQFETLLESNTRAQYVVRMVELWSTQRLMFVGAIIVLAGSLSIAVTYESISQGLAGAALAGSLTILQNVSFSARYFTKMEAQMSSVERIIEYAALPPEKEDIDIMLTEEKERLVEEQGAYRN